MWKRRVVGRIYGMKYSWNGHKDRNRHKKRIKRSGQAQFVYAFDINRNIPIREGEPTGTHAGRFVCHLQGQGHSKGSYDQNMTLSTISADSLATRLGLMVHRYMPECLVKKMDYCNGQCYSEGSKPQECLSRQYLLNHQTFYYQTWYGDASAWVGVSCKKSVLLSWRSRSQQGLICFVFSIYFFVSSVKNCCSPVKLQLWIAIGEF